VRECGIAGYRCPHETMKIRPGLLGRPAQLREGVDPMGRGRAKAKQTKVARELKYRSYETDFSQLERELRGDNGDEADSSDDENGEDHGPDPYADDSPSRKS
jgi:hypothetical protein